MRRTLLIVGGMALAALGAVLVIGPSSGPDAEAPEQPATPPAVVVEPREESTEASAVEPIPEVAPAEPNQPPDESQLEAAQDPGQEAEEPVAQAVPSPGNEIGEGQAAESASIVLDGGSLFDDREAHTLVWEFETRAYAERYVEFVNGRASVPLDLELVSTEDAGWQVRVPYTDEDDRSSRLEEIERITGFSLQSGGGR